MENFHLYNTSLEWNEGRIGTLSGPGLDSFKVATPPEFEKGVPNIWSPEHLYVAALNACLMTTFLAIAENSKLNFETFRCVAVGKLGKVEGKFVISEVELNPQLVITYEKDKDRAQRIIEKSESNCLISNSVKTKIILSPEISVKN